jgi:hypothetical protein
MKSSEKIIIILGVLTVLGLAALVTVFLIKAPPTENARVTLSALKAPSPDQALITFLSGRVYVYRGREWKAAGIGDFLEAEDYVRAFADAYCEIQFGDGSVVAVQENTLLKMSQVFHGDQGLDIELDLKLGTVLCSVEKLAGNSRFTVKSETLAFGVRGTKFFVQKRQGKTLVAVEEGKVAVLSPETGAEKLLVGDKQEVEIDDTKGSPGELKDLSALSESQLELINKLKLLPLKEKYIIELVKIAVVANPLDAEIYLGGQRVGYGVYAGLFPAGTELAFTVKHTGYVEKSFSVTAEKGGDSEYRVKLVLAEPMAGLAGENVSVDLKALADELKDNIELLKNKLQITEAEKEKFRGKMQELNDDLKKLSQKDSELEIQVKQLRDEKTKLQQDLKVINEEMKSLQTELDQKNELLRSIHEQSGKP